MENTTLKPQLIEKPRPGFERDFYGKDVLSFGNGVNILRGDYRDAAYSNVPSQKSGYIQYWLEEDGEVIAYLNTLYGDEGENLGPILCSIQVRDAYLGKGYASKLMKMVAQLTNETLYTTGSCTPKGYAALRGKLPLLPGREWSACFRDMDFVDNEECWELCVTRM